MREKRKVTPIRPGTPTRGPKLAGPKLTVSQAVERGDTRELLVAVKRRIALAMDATTPRDLAALSRQLSKVTAEIEAFDQAAEEAAAKAAGGEQQRTGAVPWDPGSL